MDKALQTYIAVLKAEIAHLTTKLKISPPNATAARYRSESKWPNTAVSTKPNKGVDILLKIIGIANRSNG